ncbi:MAG: regulatory protein RecX [Pontibacterium sp.]
MITRVDKTPDECAANKSELAIEAETQRKALYNQCIGLLARRDYSQGELRKRFVGKFMPEVIEDVLHELGEKNYQSDARFASSWVRHRASQRYGEVRIKKELREKRISQADVANAFANNDIDWFALALEAWRKKFGRLANMDYAQRNKAYRHLLQRGFTYDQVQFALETGSAELNDQLPPSV